MIPEISEEVCNVLDHELDREQLSCLEVIISRLEEEQPHLFHEIACGVNTITANNGIFAGEAALRLCLIVYKLIEAQIEAEELENANP